MSDIEKTARWSVGLAIAALYVAPGAAAIGVLLPAGAVIPFCVYGVKKLWDRKARLDAERRRQEAAEQQVLADWSRKQERRPAAPTPPAPTPTAAEKAEELRAVCAVALAGIPDDLPEDEQEAMRNDILHDY